MRAKTFATGTAPWRACAIGLVLLCLPACSALADKAITKVNVVDKSDRVIINVKGNHSLGMTVLKSTRGDYVGFQFPCTLAAKGKKVGIRGGKIYFVRYSNFKAHPPATRIVVNTGALLSQSTQWSNDRRSVEISVWKYGSDPNGKRTVTAVSGFPLRSNPETPTQKLRTVVEKPGAEPVCAEVSTPRKEPVVKVKPASATVSSPPRVVKVAMGSSSLDGAGPAVRVNSLTSRMTRISSPIAQQPETERTVSLNFLGADINDVLKALSVQSGENIVAGKDVSGNVTVSLADVGLEEALDYVARLSGYSYAQEKNTYLVGTRDSLRNLMSEDTRAPKVEVVALNYADGDSVMSLIKSQYPGVQTSKSSAAAKTATEGPVSGSTGDVIVLSGLDSTVTEAKQLIAQVEDSLRSRAAKETARVYKVKYVSPFELQRTIETLVPEVRATVAPSDGFKLFAPEAVKVGSGSGAGGATVERAKVKTDTEELGWIQALVFYGTETAVDRAVDLASELDVKSPQIKIEAKIVSLNKSGEKKLGVNWNWGDFGWLEGFTDFEKTYNMTPDGENKQNVWKSHRNLIRQPWSVIGQLDALIEQGDGQLLANPSMVCVEGKPGVFFVGDEVRYIILIQNTTTGQNVQTETANVGVQLRVVGDVSTDGFITLNLHPEVSVIQLNVNEETGITLPIITRRFTDHVVRVRDGQTIAIGGLIRDEELDTMSKIPILGDIPFLGKLFRHRHKTTDHSEVAMFITASVIQD